MKRIAVVTSPIAAGLLIAPSFHLAIGDFVLFRSDFPSLAIYLAFAGAILGAVLLAGVLLVGLCPRLGTSRRQIAAALLGIACSAGLLAAACASTVKAINVVGLDAATAKMVMAAGPWFLLPPALIAFSGAIVLLWLLLRLIDRQPEVAARLDQLGLAVVAFAIAASAAGWVGHVASAPLPATGDRSRHLVLLVLDRMPAWGLRSYRSDAPSSAFDKELSGQMRVFHNMQTVHPYTHGFFGALYEGRLPGDAGGSNLLRRLDERGVAVTMITGHRNATPEGSAAVVSRYGGLRSRLLGPDSAALPRLLGLNYHLNITEPGRNEGPLLKATWLLLNPGGVTADVLQEEVLPTVEDSAARYAQTFTIFHLSISRFSNGDTEDDSPQFASDNADTLIAAARRNDYRYEPTPENNAAIRQRYNKVAAEVPDFGEKFKAFLDALRHSEVAGDAAVIVTSDHGNIYDKGRVFYGYHPQREVVRVPFLVFGGTRPGDDHRLLGTLDLSHSVLDYFDAAEPPLAIDAVSLFGAEARGETASLTRRADQQKEWFLVIFRGDKVYRLNLHPQASTSIEGLRYGEFYEVALPLDEDLEEDLLAAAHQWLLRFDVSPKETNLAD